MLASLILLSFVSFAQSLKGGSLEPSGSLNATPKPKDELPFKKNIWGRRILSKEEKDSLHFQALRNSAPTDAAQAAQADSRARQQVLQAELNTLRTKEELLSKQTTKIASMTNEQRYNFNREQSAIRNERIAKEYQLKELQRLEQEAQRGR